MCELIYSICVQESKQASKMDNHTLRESYICVCVCVCQIWEREDRENTRIRLCVYVCVRESVSERERETGSLATIF